ncbi:tRNA (mnm(5)s(2)U34)-methyltransferase / FAD-dependent cmnm(5)s(2)U34 oxidoreductase [Rubrivivax sp. A210]|uniref:FAD-dependent 5-carboxymethylaminomethyl-2-thiouridine(34) oxidoreductase MnmC n=1 Tax=Rubrivivax sp. A210 TaxID=2772301 RepID=UPI00191A259B|nr:FAD-dependent 5-carboxymethylaminomethyl-2-thiouridine(34) oxidoreductase MnmC [Rubrivivax sp. A210]CAD5372873.1 tRNA (mnm(5)s(2)U34)-methyltransferase / FAD-dependent cmnm(5)s(2)U34 oxidoreductase [Rubrivivax sp. A210]
MKSLPLEPAQIEFSADGGPPRAPRYGDLYHPQIGALAQARHVFLGGNGLPARWGGRTRFVVLETGFGLGNNFLATWDAWRRDPARCERLIYVSIERHPPYRVDLARAHVASDLPDLAAQLVAAWPPLVAGLQTLEFEGGALQLLLGLGDASELLPGLRLAGDAFYLDGFAPARNPQMWQPRVLKALGRCAAAGATAATWSVARELREGLQTAGFAVDLAPGIGGKREITRGRFAPRYAPRPLPTAAVPEARSALVVGAGLAGAAVALALARQGLAVTVFERRAMAAAETSGNPAGIFHGSVHADDGPYARLFRAGALAAQREFLQALREGVPGRIDGLLRLAEGEGGGELLQRLGLPADYVAALDRATASARAGVALPQSAWLYGGGGWISPADWVRHALARPGIRLVTDVDVAGLERCEDGWCLRGGDGAAQGTAPIAVLANAASASALLAPLGHAAWPLGLTRGQVSFWPKASPATRLALPVAGDGYAIPLPDGGLLCGATRQADDVDPGLREDDHRDNLRRLQSLTGLSGPAEAELWQGRVGWRLASEDRLPIAGALPLPALPPGTRQDQARLLPRERGLFVLTALGARGLTLAPLLGRLIAAQATGAPWPLEQDLADAVDPARWIVRAARAAQPAA